MKQKNTFFGLFAVATLIASIVLQVLPPDTASAAQITTRSLTLQAGAGGDGGSMPGGTVNHVFNFTVPGGSDVGSIRFQYCTTAAAVANGLDCDTPTGLNTTSAALGAESGASGFNIVNATNGMPYLTRTAANVNTNTVLSYRLDNIVNPTTTNQTFHVRITTYLSTDTSGSIVDSGTVTSSTATQIILDGTMPESLVFCAGATIGLTAGVPDCATATSGVISFNQLFSPTDTATASSQMAASTNAGSGYVITVNGPTLTSGSNTISPMAARALGIRGVSQFGMNLKENTVLTSTPAIGAEVSLASNGTNYRAQATTDYGTVDEFKYITGDSVADSAFGGAGGSDAQIFTASYIVNVPGSQPAGTYTTTLTYICTPTF